MSFPIDFFDIKIGQYFYSPYTEFKKIETTEEPYTYNTLAIYNCVCTFTIGTTYKVGKKYYCTENKLILGRHPMNKKNIPDEIT